MVVARRQSSSFTPAPEGPQQVVCVDVVDLGLIEQTWGEEAKLKPMVRIVWHSSEHDPDTGKPYVISQRYTLSLHEKAKLLHDLEAWRGRAFTDAELAGFELDDLIGANAYVQIVHNISKGTTYANISSIMQLPKNMSPIPVTPGYLRQQDRAPDVHADHVTQPDPRDDDIPF